jgi:hypothetical protein
LTIPTPILDKNSPWTRNRKNLLNLIKKKKNLQKPTANIRLNGKKLKAFPTKGKDAPLTTVFQYYAGSLR